MAASPTLAWRPAVQRRNSIGIMSAYRVQPEPDDRVQARPEDCTPGQAAELLLLRGMQRSEHDLAKLAQARPCQHVQSLQWNSGILTAAQLRQVGGEAVRDPPQLPRGAGTPPQQPACSESTSALHRTAGGKPPPGGSCPSDRRAATQSPSSSSAAPSPPPPAPARAPAPTPAPMPAPAPATSAARLAAPVATVDRALAREVHTLNRSSQRRLAQLDSLGVFTPRTNCARVEAERAARVRRCVAGHLEMLQRDEARKGRKIHRVPSTVARLPRRGGKGGAGADGVSVASVGCVGSIGGRGGGSYASASGAGGDAQNCACGAAAAAATEGQRVLRRSASAAQPGVHSGSLGAGRGAGSPNGSWMIKRALAQARVGEGGATQQAGPGAEHDPSSLAEAHRGTGGGAAGLPARSISGRSRSRLGLAAAEGRAGIDAAVKRAQGRGARVPLPEAVSGSFRDKAASTSPPVRPSVRAAGGGMRGLAPSRSGADLVGAAGRGGAADGGAGMRRAQSVAVMDRPQRLGEYPSIAGGKEGMA
jgi:hypothetical protein